MRAIWPPSTYDSPTTPLSNASRTPSATSSMYTRLKPSCGKAFARSLPVRVWSMKLPSSEWSPGPYTPPGCTITIGAPFAILSFAIWCDLYFVSS